MHIELWALRLGVLAAHRPTRRCFGGGGGWMKKGDVEEKGRARRTASERLLLRESREHKARPPWLVITLELASGSVQGEEDRAPPSLVRGAKSHGNRFM